METLPRLKPRFESFPLVSLVIGCLLLLLLIIDQVCGFLSGSMCAYFRGWFWCPGIIFGLPTFGYGVAKVIPTWRAVRMFSRGDTTAIATVLDCRDEARTDSYGRVRHTYKVVFEFDTIEKRVNLAAQVSHAVYPSLVVGGRITVRYANADPRVALLEGEDK